MSLAEVVLQAEDLKHVPFPTPEWPSADGKLFIRPMSGFERMEWEQSFQPPEERVVIVPVVDARTLVAGRCLVDEFGGQVFQSDQLEGLSKKNALVLDRAYDAILKLSAIRRTVAEVEAAQKNSETTGGGGSSTG